MTGAVSVRLSGDGAEGAVGAATWASAPAGATSRMIAEPKAQKRTRFMRYKFGLVAGAAGVAGVVIGCGR
jgi:hypothetical protein